MKKKFLIVTTIPWTLEFFKGQLQVLKKEFDVELVSSPGDKLDKICIDENIIGHPIKMRREISIFHDIKSLVTMIFLFLKLKPFTVHGNTPKAGLLSMMASKLTLTPLRIYYIHGLRYEGTKGFKRKLLINMERLTCYLATDVFAVSYGVKEVLSKEGITKKKINIIYNGSINGINTNHFSPFNEAISNLSSDYDIKDGTVVFGYVGRLVADKGINELVKAFLFVHKKYVNTKLLLVGDFEENLDPLESDVKEEIFENNDILNVGYQEDIRPFIKMMDVFVFPSYREGFGLSLMEAAAMGVPAVSSNIIGCNEVIKNNYNGILIPSRSVKAVQDVMIELINNPDKIKKMGSVSRNYVIEKYDQQKVWNKTVEHYLKLINSVDV